MAAANGKRPKGDRKVDKDSSGKAMSCKSGKSTKVRHRNTSETDKTDRSLSFHMKNERPGGVFTPAARDIMRRFVEEVTKGGVHTLRLNYAELKSFVPPENAKTASDAHPNKCRYKDVGCLDKTRIVLSWPPGVKGDFIHANKVTHKLLDNSFICCQGPMENTVNDFWRMVWQEKVKQIIMLCRCEEMGKPKCAQYWPEKKDETRTFHGLTVKNENIDTKDPSFVKSTLLLTFENEQRHVDHRQWTTWPDKSVPKTPLAPFRLLQYSRKYTKNPSVVHCSAGIGRTGTLVMIEIVYKSLFEAKMPDMMQLTRDLRSQRSQAVQTEDQYVYVHYALIQLIFAKDVVTKAEIKPFCKEYENYVKLLNANNGKQLPINATSLPESPKTPLSQDAKKETDEAHVEPEHHGGAVVSDDKKADGKRTDDKRTDDKKTDREDESARKVKKEGSKPDLMAPMEESKKKRKKKPTKSGHVKTAPPELKKAKKAEKAEEVKASVWPKKEENVEEGLSPFYLLSTPSLPVRPTLCPPPQDAAVEPKSEPKGEQKIEPKVEQKSEPKAEAKAEPKSDSKDEAKAESKSEPKAEPKCVSKDEPKVEPKSEPKSEPKPEPPAEPKAEVKAEPKVETKSEQKTEPNAEQKGEQKIEPKMEPEPKKEPSVVPPPTPTPAEVPPISLAPTIQDTADAHSPVQPGTSPAVVPTPPVAPPQPTPDRQDPQASPVAAPVTKPESPAPTPEAAPAAAEAPHPVPAPPPVAQVQPPAAYPAPVIPHPIPAPPPRVAPIRVQLPQAPGHIDISKLPPSPALLPPKIPYIPAKTYTVQTAGGKKATIVYQRPAHPFIKAIATPKGQQIQHIMVAKRKSDASVKAATPPPSSETQQR